MKSLILDGYNVIHAIPELEKRLHQSLEAARQALIDYCVAYCDARGDVARICIVFDGKSDFFDLPQNLKGKVRVVFSQAPEKADDVILDLVRDGARGEAFTIVSNDTYVFNNSKALAAKVISVAEFQRDADRKTKPVFRQRETRLDDDKARAITEEYKKILKIK